MNDQRNEKVCLVEVVVQWGCCGTASELNVLHAVPALYGLLHRLLQVLFWQHASLFVALEVAG